MNNELMEAIEMLEREKDISRDVLFDAIETSLAAAYQNHFSKSGIGYADRSEGGNPEYTNVRVEIDRQTGEYHVYSIKEVVEEVTDPVLQISLEEASKSIKDIEVGQSVDVPVQSKDFSRIATSTAKNSILQKIREEERSIILNQFMGKERDIVTGIVQRQVRGGLSINLGKTDALLMENEMVPGENLRPNDRVKVFVLEVRKTPKAPKIHVSRTHPELVKKLFEAEVAEVQDGTVEIRAISREAGSRTKMAVWSNNPDVDPVGACVGVNGSRVNMVVDELRGEKVDIVNWDDNPAILIENALSPAKVISVIADADERSAKVTVPDNQLSLAIGKEGQNARLAAKLTGFKIDIKSETQAKDAPGFRLEDYYDENGEFLGDEYYEEENGEYYEEEAASEDAATEETEVAEEAASEETEAAE
ncbi:MAG: transcription termination/antitermination protein NusA [Lachnospiraceae bacterium]|nr:transcription termination/antitermination protein NusA [Lachnospiraceae bacterium]